ncbi:hypothetical protein ISN45_Aa06g005880 [Arabidopsis thaliana x Arabidopsis arenosa]|nr:hypothetical protein ISN45_Aa06g005880 [Arabidopsis thaliana x Arabidopsis arenosa]
MRTSDTIEKALIQAKAGRRHILAEMAKCSPPPTLSLSKYTPLIHIMKKVKSIIEESVVEAIKVGDCIDLKLIEVNEKGQLRLSVRALLPESETDKDSQKQQPAGDSTKDKGSQRKYVNTSSKDRAAAGASKVSSGDELVLKKKE